MRLALAAMTAALAWLAAGAVPASAAGPEGALQGSKSVNGTLNLLFTAVDGADSVPITPGTVRVTVTRGQETKTFDKPTVSNPEAGGKTGATRSAMLVLDTSESMTPERLDAAKNAANVYLDSAPRDVMVGLVTFGDPPRTLQAPTADRELLKQQISGLKAKGDTAMFEAVISASKILGDATGRSIVLLTDGANDDRKPPTYRTPDKAMAAVKGIDVVGVAVGDEGKKAVASVEAVAGAGHVVEADDGADLKGLLADQFRTRTEALDNQVLVTVPLPADLAKDGEVEVTAYAAGTKVSATSPYYSATRPTPAPSAAAAPRVVTPDPRLTAVSTPIVVAAIVGLFGALCILIATATGALVRNPDEDSEVVRRLSVYTFSGREARRTVVAEQTTALGSSAVARGAVELADRLARGRNLETALDSRLDAAGLPLRTAEWSVVHVAVTLGGALLFLLVGGGTILSGVLGLLLGLVAPWLFLAMRQSRRESKFLSQLPDTLQLLAGSLQAGYSLPQAMDTVVREARAPIGTEFNRALVEARLGVPPEDALEGIARRTRSRDFGWIVMAIKIQKDVGGNLAELLGTVAETLRERERLRRQVSALSAEGRLSGIILAGLPVVFTVYLALVRPDYLEPMITTRMGLTLLAMGVALLAIGAVWMSRVVKVQV
jgi:tight adherence protein B